MAGELDCTTAAVADPGVTGAFDGRVDELASGLPHGGDEFIAAYGIGLTVGVEVTVDDRRQVGGDGISHGVSSRLGLPFRILRERLNVGDYP